MFGVLLLVFWLFTVLPGDPAQMTMGQRSDLATLEAVNKELGLDLPRHEQLLKYINQVSPLSLHPKQSIPPVPYWQLLRFNSKVVVLKVPFLGNSFQTKATVNSLIAGALPATLLLALSAMSFATVLGIFLGGLAAFNSRNHWNNAIVLISTLGVSLPSYFAAVLIAYLLGYILHDYTGLGMTGSLFDYHPFDGRFVNLKNLILPALTLGLRPLAIITQLSRSAFLDVMGKDFVRTGLAKGLTKRGLFFKHILRNALAPVVTAISGWFASLLTGAVFVEYIFGWKGLGSIAVDALLKFDLPLIMGVVLCIAFAFVLINILVDLIYFWLDPRLQLKQL